MELATLGVVLAGYAIAVIVVGILATRRAGESPEEYFLAGRKLGPLVLFMALFGTNATSFVLVGIPGKAYHDGIGIFGLNAAIVALCAPLTFFLIGVPARRMAMKVRAVTPAELYAKRFAAPLVGMVLFFFFLIYTLPYMVVAVKGAAVTLTDVTDGAIPYWLGSASVIAIALVYTTLGGMRATAWTNVMQGTIFVVFIVVACALIARSLGDFETAMRGVESATPELLVIDHGKDLFEPRQWASWGLLISLTVIAFPHMFVRIMAAESERALKSVCKLYPIATAVLWLPPVLIGIWGAVDFPGLLGKESDRIYAMMLTEHLPGVLAAVGFLAVLAAVMSTLDAQILTLGSMLTRDVLAPLRGESPGETDIRNARFFGMAIAVVVWILAMVWGQSVFQIASIAFSGYVTLTPALYLGATWRRFNKQGMLASILIGNAVLALGTLGWLPMLGFLPVFWAWLAAVAAALLVTRFTPPPNPALAFVAFGFQRKKKKTG